MPEIGLRTTFFLCVVMLIGGILIGTHVPLVWQALIVVALIFFITSRAVRALELGAACYVLIVASLCVGIVVGDISYFFQRHTDVHVGNPFKAP